jgi:hypothetical protein
VCVCARARVRAPIWWNQLRCKLLILDTIHPDIHHIYVRKDVRIRGYCTKPKGTHCTTVFSKCLNVLPSDATYPRRTESSVCESHYPDLWVGRNINGFCPPRSPLCSIVDLYLWVHLRDILAPNMASHGTNYALHWSGWCNVTRAWNFSACHEFLSDTGFSYANWLYMVFVRCVLLCLLMRREDKRANC